MSRIRPTLLNRKSYITSFITYYRTLNQPCTNTEKQLALNDITTLYHLAEIRRIKYTQKDSFRCETLRLKLPPCTKH